MHPSTGSGSLAAFRAAALKGIEPPPARALVRLPYYRWLVVGAVCIGAFMGQVDSSIALLLLPRLEADFGARLSTVSWVAVAYTVTMAGCLPIFGRLADIVGRKLLYTGGFLLFVVGSGLCGLAPSLPTLIVFRVVQAIGAGLLAANSVAIVVTAAGPERRGRALGVQAAAQAIGLSAGPMIGGLLLATLGWRWVFWINVPVGLVASVIGWLVIPPTSGLTKDSRFDWTGALMIVPALAAFLAAVNEAHVWGAVSPAFFGAILVSAILLFSFARRELRHDYPLIDFALLKNRIYVAGNAAALMSYATLFGVFFLMPFLFIRVYHDDALTAGLRLAIIPVAIGVVAPFAGGLSDRLGARILTVAGISACLGALVFLYFGIGMESASLLAVMLALAAFGVGQGLFASPNNNSIMAAAPRRLTGEAGGLMNVVRSVGMSVGIAAASALLSWRLEALIGHVVNTVHAPPQLLLHAGRDDLLLLIAFAAIAGLISLVGPHAEPRP